MKLDFECAALEAVLFAAGEPLETARLAEALETDRETVQSIAERLSAFLTESGSALQLLTLGDSYQLSTAAVHAETVRRALEVKRNTPLSNAAMEVLTIIAYNQPVTKGFVERVRGVDSSSVVNTLTERGLLEEAGRIEVPGRPVTYRTTAQFLRCFGLSSLDELPQLPSNTETDPFTVQSAEDELTAEDTDEAAPEENLETIEQEDSAEPAPEEE